MSSPQEAILNAGGLEFIGLSALAAMALTAVCIGSFALLKYGATLPVHDARGAVFGAFVIGGVGVFAGVGAFVSVAGGAYAAFARHKRRGESSD